MSFPEPNQFYRAVEADMEKQQLKISINPPEIGTTLLDLWEKEFSYFKKVNVCLSGGIDSQFILSILKKLNKDISIYIFSFVWEDCVFNSSDVTHATRYCNKFGYNYSLIEIDCEKFFKEDRHFYYAKTYNTISPQVALQLHMLDHISNSYPTFLGCDTPMLQYNFESLRARPMNMNSFLSIPLPFLNYGNLHQKPIIKEIFSISPETYYLGFKQFIETTKTHKIVVDENFCPPGISQPVRKLFYSDLGADLLPPLLKNTGFETLKMHLAKQTGIYNEFDLRYRYPLAALLKSEKNFDLGAFRTIIKNNHLNNLIKEFEELCRETPDIKPIKLYNFIL